MFKRRDFIKKGLLISGASVLGLKSIESEAKNNWNNINFNLNNDEFWDQIRKQFPLNNDRIFLNNGTMGPSPYSVLKTVQEAMFEIESKAIYGGEEKDTIQAIANFFNTKEAEISLTRNVTEGINIVCWGLNLKKGDEVIMTKHEHIGNAGPWLSRAKQDGIKIKTFDLGKTAIETIENINKIINKKTKVLAIPHIPCTIGQILPIKEICKLAKTKGIFTFIDGAHPPGMLNFNISDLDCDAYSACCHKWMLGPKGTGFLYIKNESRHFVSAKYGGAGVDTGWNLLLKEPKMEDYIDNGHRYFYGTQNAALFKGIQSAIEFQAKIGKAKIEERILSLSTYLQNEILAIGDQIEMLTPTESISRGAQIAFKIKNKSMIDLYKKCSDNKITVRHVPENEVNCIRVSTHIYNQKHEIDTFIDLTKSFIKS